MAAWFSRQSPLQLAIARGLKPGGKLYKEIDGLGEVTISSEAHAVAICNGLKTYQSIGKSIGGYNALGTLVRLFLKLEDSDGGKAAFVILSSQGTALLANIVDDAIRNPEKYAPDEILSVLKTLAIYQTPEGTETVIRVARVPLVPDNYWWKVVFDAYSVDHPQRVHLFQSLSNPLPRQFMGVALLDCSNAAHIAGATDPHPFDSDEGHARLREWLQDKNEDHFSYAHSAAVALPFIGTPTRNDLLAIALDHPSSDVQLEAALSSAKLGSEAGVRWLVRACLDVNLSIDAKAYLTKLGRESMIPTESEEPEFRAKAEFIDWLKHPAELGRAPDSIEVVDHRPLAWPPDGKPDREFWLLKYLVNNSEGANEPDVGVGLVGSVTFCFFGYELEQRPPTDCYAIHCFWEMQHRELIALADVEDDSHEHDGMLKQFVGEMPADVRIVHVAELASSLEYPQNIICIAEATHEGSSGWAVLDGPRSHWYAAAEMPNGTSSKTVLMLHVGRHLLGFTEEPNRKQYLK